MASVELTVAGHEEPGAVSIHHLTLLHFEQPEDLAARKEYLDAAHTILKAITERNRGRTIEGVWGEATKMGRYRNVPARLVISRAVVGLRTALQKAWDAEHLPYSKNFEGFSPHVSHPSDDWKLGAPARFVSGIDLVAKPDRRWYEL